MVKFGIGNPVIPPSGDPDLPLSYDPGPYTLPTGGTTHNVSTALEFQTALDAAVGGDVINITESSVLVGYFIVPDHGDTEGNWVYIKTSGIASIAPEGTEIGTGYTSHMPIIKPPSGDFNTHAPLFFAPGAHHWRLVGLRGTFPNTTDTCYGWIRTGYEDYQGNTHISDPADLPHHIAVDRCYVQGRDVAGQNDVYGIVFNCRQSAIVDSTVLDICNQSSNDPNALIAFNGSKEILIRNSTFTASGECIIIGGSDAATGVVEQDWTFDRVRCHKRPKWFTNDPSYDGIARVVKNCFELKKIVRCLIDGCVFTDVGDQDSGQLATGMVITIRNQGGSDTFATIRDVTVRNTTVGRVGTWVHFNNQDDINVSLPLQRILFDNCLFNQHNYYQVAYGDSTYSGIKITSNNRIPGVQASSVKFRHCSFITGADGDSYSYGTLFAFETADDAAPAWDGIEVEDCIVQVGTNKYSIWGTGVTALPGGGGGTDALDAYTVNSTVTGDVLIDDNYHPNYDPMPGNEFTTLASVGFADYAGGDFRLTSGPYRAGQAHQASDGTDMGCDIDALLEAQA